MHVSIVIPAYQESDNLCELLPAINREMSKLGTIEHEIIVVLPNSASDAELAEINTLDARVIRRGPSDSFGDAIRCGFAEVSPLATWVVTMDADGSHAPSTLVHLLKESAEADVVVASRYIDGGTSQNSYVLKLMSRGLNFTYGLVLGLKCKDISTNFKRYRAQDVRLLPLTCRDFDIVEEIFFRLKVNHGNTFTVVEIPDHFYERRHGVTKRKLGPFVLSYLKTLIRLRRQADGSGT